MSCDRTYTRGDAHRLLGAHPDPACRHYPQFHKLIKEVRAYRVPLVNTSFNVRTPEDAFRCFIGTEIEALAIGDCFLRKADYDPALKRNYEHKF
jgi:carbamoyltransferase